MGKKKGEKPEGEEAFVKKEKSLAKKAEKKLRYSYFPHSISFKSSS